ncbi:MAG: PQQ-binding-like beta-propeller repeat protein [bacterium]
MRILVLLILALAVITCRAADWAQFGGPGGTGVSAETGMLREWPESGPKALWSYPLNPGFGAPAVRDGKVYLLDRDEPKRQDILRCLDLTTGVEEWNFSYTTSRGFNGYNGNYSGVRSTPLVDEKYLYIMGEFGEIRCIDRTTHLEVWKHDIIMEFRGDKYDNTIYRTTVPKWGVSQSPVLYKDMIIVAPLSETVGVVAYDKVTGVMRWKSPHIGRLYYCHMTPYVTTLGGIDQVVMVTNVFQGKDAYIAGVDANTGARLWMRQLWRWYNIPIPQPVNIGNDTLFVGGGYRIGCFTLKVTRDGDKWTTDYGFKDNVNCTPFMQNPLLFHGYLYASSNDPWHNTPERNATDDRIMVQHGLECLDLNGKIIWETGAKDNLNCGPLLIADGLIYALDGESGVLRMAEATPDGYKELGRAKVLTAKGNTVWTGMAISDGKLLLRDQHEMKCLAVR